MSCIEHMKGPGDARDVVNKVIDEINRWNRTKLNGTLYIGHTQYEALRMIAPGDPGSTINDMFFGYPIVLVCHKTYCRLMV